MWRRLFFTAVSTFKEQAETPVHTRLHKCRAHAAHISVSLMCNHNKASKAGNTHIAAFHPQHGSLLVQCKCYLLSNRVDSKEAVCTNLNPKALQLAGFFNRMFR